MGLKLVQAWVDFAVSGLTINIHYTLHICSTAACPGDPTPPGSALGSWTPVSAEAESQEYLRIDTVSAMEMSPDYLERVTFWQGIMETRPLP